MASRRGAQREGTVLDALTDPDTAGFLAGHPPTIAPTLRFLLAMALDATS